MKVHFPIKRGLLRRTVGYVKAVDGVSLALREGHTIGLVGESGSGKTTLGLALLRLESSQGGIKFDTHDLQKLSQREMRPLRRQMQIVFQDPFSSLSPRMSVGEIVGRRAAGPSHRQRGRAQPHDRRGAARSRPRTRRRANATRTNSPAASASASPSPARWC